MDVPRAWLIDASIYIFRAWFSLPDRWYTHDGRPVQAVYGYTKFLLDFLEGTGPSFVGAAAFDESLGSNWRNDIYPAYKRSRELPDEELAFQLEACREITERFGFACFGGERYEADDYLASIARLAQEQGLPITVVTRDKDLGQLMADPQDRWWDFAAGVQLDAAAFADKHGVQPGQFADYLALVGDPVDDIPGVPGIGAKTAVTLLQHFDDLEALGADLKRIPGLDIRGAARVQERLESHWSQVLMARQLTGLEEHIDEIATLPVSRVDAEALDGVVDYLAELNLEGNLSRRCRALRAEGHAT